MVLTIIFLKRDFGPMKASEDLAANGILFNEEKYGPASGTMEEAEISKAKPIDMLFPIILLIVTAVAFFPIVTWLGAIDGETITTMGQAMASMTLGDAFNDTDSSMALWYAVMFTLTATYIYYLARRLLNLKEAGEALRNGIQSMLPALIILTMAWSIGTIIKSPRADGGLGLGIYLSQLVSEGGFPIQLLPCILFVLSAIISFATGTSWGTFGIMIPIGMPIVTGLATGLGMDPAGLVNAAMISMAAVIGGAVFGDHASPISDTTILSSTGASCPHLEHVATQIPYALFVAVCTFIGFVVGGFVLNPIAAWAAAMVVFVLGIIFLPKIMKAR